MNDTAQFFTSGGTIIGAGSVGGLAFQGTSGVPWSIAAQLRSASSLVAGATELVGGGTWDAGTLAVVGGGLSVRDGGALQAGSIGLTGSAVLAVSGTGSAVVGGGAAAAGVLTVSGSLTGAGVVSAAGGIVDEGVIAASGGTLRLASSVSGGGSLLIGDGATLSLGGLSAVGVTFTGPGATLEVSSLNIGGTLVLSEKGVITGFTPGETIRDADGTPVTGATYAATGAGLGTLTLLNGSTPLGALTLAGAFDGYDFGVTHDGAGGSNITLTARVPAPEPIADPTVTAPVVTSPAPAPVPVADPVAAAPVVTSPALDPVPVADPVATAPVVTSPVPAPEPIVDPVATAPVVTSPAPDPVPVADPVATVPVVTSPVPDPVPPGVPAPVADPACKAEHHLQRNLDLETPRENSSLHRITFGQEEERMTFLTAHSSGGATSLGLQFGATMRLEKVDAPEHPGITVDHGNWKLGSDPGILFGTTFSLIHSPDAAIGANPLLHDWA